MGIKRLLKRCTTPGLIGDIISCSKEEGGFKKGIKRIYKETLTEDNPVTKGIYNMGKDDGMIEGYEMASNEYEKKLLEQADLFMQQQDKYEIERDEITNLLDEYEKEIERLSDKNEKTDKENAYLRELLIRERGLKKILM